VSNERAFVYLMTAILTVMVALAMFGYIGGRWYYPPTELGPGG
jgi:hypothetical protein